MLITLDPTQVTEFTLSADEEPKTIFKIGTLDSAERAYVLNLFSANKGDAFTFLEIVKLGLRGWDNFGVEFEKEEADIPRVGKRQVASKRSMDRLTFDYMVEIASEITRRNTISGQARKN